MPLRSQIFAPHESGAIALIEADLLLLRTVRVELLAVFVVAVVIAKLLIVLGVAVIRTTVLLFDTSSQIVNRLAIGQILLNGLTCSNKA